MWPYPVDHTVETAKARTLSSLQEMGEVNFHRLHRLIPELDALPERSTSEVKDCLPLHLTVLDRWNYTTNLLLTYELSEGRVVQPNLNIRVYHDARAVEAMSAVLNSSGALNAAAPQFTLHHKWKLNRFLYKWLGYLLHRGHHFSPR